MGESYLTWNIVNWITVVIMVAIGMTVVAAVSSIVRSKLPG